MKTSVMTLCFMLTILSLTACGQNKEAAKNDIAVTDGKGFAVLELFTSEGCSSCPPADELLAKIQKEVRDKPVYLLAYHVDYWDRQGWKDIFSNADYSKRQMQYGKWLNNPQIYTPQAIINGKSEFVGSEESQIRLAILKQLATNSGITLTLQANLAGKELQLKYQTTGALKESILSIAILQKNAQSKVTRGENTGRELSHVQIVRKLQSITLSVTGNGMVTVTLPRDFNSPDFEIIGLIQDKDNGRILGAAKAGQLF
ncbi:DUF1223 domain-containing protein [Pedobacter sp. UYP1]|uniref:DUF1223 domain-containing protein n=1 Tax=Pedobacter sp. UYP1 TaxID=1756396 RepID=UPI003393AEEB